MSQGIKISLPSYEVTTDTNLDHFALYVDTSSTDNILIKEKTRGSITLAPSGSLVINHALGYIPYILAYASGTFPIGTQTVAGWFSLSPGFFQLPPYYAVVTTQDLILQNNGTTTSPFKYFIFYDKQI